MCHKNDGHYYRRAIEGSESVKNIEPSRICWACKHYDKWHRNMLRECSYFADGIHCDCQRFIP